MKTVTGESQCGSPSQRVSYKRHHHKPTQPEVYPYLEEPRHRKHEAMADPGTQAGDPWPGNAAWDAEYSSWAP